MLLDQVYKQDTKQQIMTSHRLNFNKFKAFVLERKFDLINVKDVNKEKDMVIQHLSNSDKYDLIDYFQELSTYQEKYLILYRFMVQKIQKTQKGQQMSIDEVNNVVEVFEEKYSSVDQNEFKPKPLINIIKPNTINSNFNQISSVSSYNPKQSSSLNPSQTLIPQSNPFATISTIKRTPSLLIDQQQSPSSSPSFPPPSFPPPSFPVSSPPAPSLAPRQISQNTGLGAAIFEFFQKKQRESKTLGFKDLIEKRSNISSSNSSNSKVFNNKKLKKPNHDIEIKKLLEENKRLHVTLEKKSKEDRELNQFQKNVLREEKQRCINRIEELEEEVQQLARNNYKLQEIQKSQRQAETLVIQNSSMQSLRNQFNPYYIKPRANNLQVITENNKIAKKDKELFKNKDSHSKQQILLQMVEEIPPIEKKEQYSFDDQGYRRAGKNNYYNGDNNNNNILGLLDGFDQKPPSPKRQRHIFKQPNPKTLPFTTGSQQPLPQFHPQNQSSQSSLSSPNFESFSLAQTAYNNSSLFLNASKNQIAIDSQTSTRSKVAFFKNSLVLYRDEEYQIAFKKSNVSENYEKLRIIFYVNNKGNFNQIVNIEYDYETNYYQLNVVEKLRNVGPQQQAREVIEVGLQPKCEDLNSVIDVHFAIGHRKFDLWVPACFIAWTKDSLIQGTRQMGFMTVQPDRQFSNYENMVKIMPLAAKLRSSNDQIQTYMFGRSKFGNHQIKLTWWQKQLTIDANVKILDFLAFVLHHFK